MKITKYSHACLIIEHDTTRLVIDPGQWSDDLEISGHVNAVVITHSHPDHIDPVRLKSIKRDNPDCLFLSHTEVAVIHKDIGFTTVESGQTVQVGDMKLAFVGGEHAAIHPSMDQIANLGVIVNDVFYYPGDSFALPGKDIDVLALPEAAPWMKTSEAMDFYKKVQPKKAFPTHDGVLSFHGKQFTDQLLLSVAEAINSDFIRLNSGDTLEV